MIRGKKCLRKRFIVHVFVLVSKIMDLSLLWANMDAFFVSLRHNFCKAPMKPLKGYAMKQNFGRGHLSYLCLLILSSVLHLFSRESSFLRVFLPALN